MLIFNILMFISFMLVMISLVIAQAYFILESYKEFKRYRDAGFLVTAIGLSGTIIATVSFMVAVSLNLFGC